MITDIATSGIVTALAFVGFGFEIANRIYKDENVQWSLAFYIISLSCILDSHIAKGYLHWVLVVTLIFLCFNSLLYTLSKKTTKN
jgi:hypothetical protein